MIETPSSGWSFLGREIWQRLRHPLENPSYFVFFFLSMLFGMIGVWGSLAVAWIGLTEGQSTISILSTEGTLRSILTFFASVGATSCARIIVVEDEKKHFRSLFAALLIVFFILAVLTILMGYEDPLRGMVYAISGSVLAAITWWVANWEDTSFYQPEGPATLGGRTDTPPAGDTRGFRV